MNFGQLELSILWPAFLAGLLVLATHVPLGQQVLARGIVFIDLAIAQVAGLGVTVADAVGFEPQGWRVQGAAVAAALLGALLLTWSEKNMARSAGGVDRRSVRGGRVRRAFDLGQQSARRRAFEGSAGRANSLGVAGDAHSGCGAVRGGACCVVRISARLGQIGFYVLFALVVTQSVQLVGIYLVFASLIMPALAARLFPEAWRLAAAMGSVLSPMRAD